MQLFKEWIEGTISSEWDFINSQLQHGFVSPISMKYLVRPNDILVNNTKGFVRAYMARGDLSLLSKQEDELEVRAEPVGSTESSSLPAGSFDLKSSPPPKKYEWSISSWGWGFDGSFRQAEKELHLEITSTFPRDTVPIASMNVFPLRYGDPKLGKLLKTRGERFWACRNRMMVSYANPYSSEATVVSSSVPDTNVEILY